MLGGFKCSKNTLIGLNAFYIIVGILLISLGSHWSSSNMISSLPIIGGIVACGVFLILISAVGIIGASRHHQVMLFFYMVILFIVFLIQFSVACACLSVSFETQDGIAKRGWENLDNNTKKDVQKTIECCGFTSVNNTEIEHNLYHPPCYNIDACNHINETTTCTNEKECCSEFNLHCSCETCDVKVRAIMNKAFQVTGGVSLFFSFTEIIGAVFAWRFRNLYANGLSSS